MTFHRSNSELTGVRTSESLERFVFEILDGINHVSRASVYYQYCGHCVDSWDMSRWFEAFFITDTDRWYRAEACSDEVNALRNEGKLVVPCEESGLKFLKHAKTNLGSFTFSLKAVNGATDNVVYEEFGSPPERLSDEMAICGLGRVHRTWHAHVPKQSGCRVNENDDVWYSWDTRFTDFNDETKLHIYENRHKDVSALIRAVPHVRHIDTDVMIVDERGVPILLIEESAKPDKNDTMTRKLAALTNSGKCPTLKITTRGSDRWVESTSVSSVPTRGESYMTKVLDMSYDRLVPMVREYFGTLNVSPFKA